ncbi:hypothetical protein BGP_3059 [Beggiatoa sp. PS]|nr:hypothetical protein BGP_3059 [Beggiatoa sp. PS]
MLLAELENKFIKPLPRLDKLQLLMDVTKMLQQEEERPEKYFEKRVEYPLVTPTITQDDTSYKAAYQLQQLWKADNNA